MAAARSRCNRLLPQAANRRWVRRQRNHVLVGVAFSALGHASVILLLLTVLDRVAVWLAPPPPGVNSIQLVASLASSARQRPEPLPAPPARWSLSMAGDPATPDRAAAAGPRPLAVRKQGPLPAAALPVEAEFQAMAKGASRLRLQRAQPAAQRRPDAAPDAPPAHLARADSAPSIASRRSAGVKTDSLPRKIPALSPPPIYPPDALARRLGGRVDLRVRVGRDGRVARASVYRSSGLASLDEAALDAVRRWRFRPARIAGRPVSKEVLVPIEFVIVRSARTE